MRVGLRRSAPVASRLVRQLTELLPVLRGDDEPQAGSGREPVWISGTATAPGIVDVVHADVRGVRIGTLAGRRAPALCATLRGPDVVRYRLATGSSVSRRFPVQITEQQWY